MNKDDLHVNIETTAVKQRWGVRDIETNGDETTDEIRMRKDSDQERRRPSTKHRIDFTNIRPTDMKYNTDINLPDPSKGDSEAQIQYQKQATIKAIDQFISDNCDTKGVVKDAKNLSEAEERGLKVIREKVNDGEWVIYTTDKSSKLVIDTPVNYLDSMKEHTEHDVIANYKEVSGKENFLNNHCQVWSKILKMGSRSKQFRRCKATLTSRFKPIPVLGGARKDHKPCSDPRRGPKQRPICQARIAPNAPLGNIITSIIKGVSEELCCKLQTESGSTEEVQRIIDDGNAKIRTYLDNIRVKVPRTAKENTDLKMKIDKGNLVIGSMDVKALYPSIQWISGAKEISKAVGESKVKIAEMDDRELCQYIAIEFSDEEIKAEGVRSIIPGKKKGTNLRKTAREGDQSDLLDYSETDQMTDKDRRKVLSLAVRKAVHTVLSHHYYTFGGVIRRQSRGGSIGSEMTGEMARIYMLRWDDKFLTKLKKLGITPYIYTRYVDDTLILVDSIMPGIRYRSGKLLWINDEKQIKEDMEMSDDARTFMVLRQIANSIDPEIQWEEDVPSNHANQKLPCLDMEIWYSQDDKKIYHSFYKKPMSSKYLILKRSTVSETTKRHTIFQKGIRRLMNCSPELVWAIKADP